MHFNRGLLTQTFCYYGTKFHHYLSPSLFQSLPFLNRKCSSVPLLLLFPPSQSFPNPLQCRSSVKALLSAFLGSWAQSSCHLWDSSPDNFPPSVRPLVLSLCLFFPVDTLHLTALVFVYPEKSEEEKLGLGQRTNTKHLEVCAMSHMLMCDEILQPKSGRYV